MIPCRWWWGPWCSTVPSLRLIFVLLSAPWSLPTAAGFNLFGKTVIATRLLGGCLYIVVMVLSGGSSHAAFHATVPDLP